MTATDKDDWRLLNQPFAVDIHEALLQQHHAAQFIAMTGQHLIARQPDDSHTNMEYLPEREWLIGNID